MEGSRLVGHDPHFVTGVPQSKASILHFGLLPGGDKAWHMEANDAPISLFDLYLPYSASLNRATS